MSQVVAPKGLHGTRYVSHSLHVLCRKDLILFQQLWNTYQSMIPAHERSTVIYGHDSRRGLQLHDYSKGLDSGCVTGGKLTAMIIDDEVQGGEARTVSVPCKDYSDPKKEDMGEEE